MKKKKKKHSGDTRHCVNRRYAKCIASCIAACYAALFGVLQSVTTLTNVFKSGSCV